MGEVDGSCRACLPALALGVAARRQSAALCPSSSRGRRSADTTLRGQDSWLDAIKAGQSKGRCRPRVWSAVVWRGSAAAGSPSPNRHTRPHGLSRIHAIGRLRRGAAQRLGQASRLSPPAISSLAQGSFLSTPARRWGVTGDAVFVLDQADEAAKEGRGWSVVGQSKRRRSHSH